MLSSARRLLTALCIAFGALSVAAPLATAPAPAVAAPADQAKYAAIVIDADTGEVLYAKRADSPRYPASITKVMTLYLAYEALAKGELKLTDTVTMSPRAAAQPPSKLGLAAGQTLTVEEAIQALAIKSANDVAVAMAEKIGGTEPRFAALMTLKAQELGMTGTRFVNASGLPDSRQLSSARDIALLSRAVMRDYPQYYGYFSQKSFTWRGQSLRNHNGLLHRMPGVDGIKTGFTNASGYNLAASAVRDGKRLITVVLGGTSTRARDNHVEELLNTGFDVFRRRKSGEVIHVAQNLFETPPAQTNYALIGPKVAAEPTDITGALNRASGTAGMAPIADPPEAPVVLASMTPEAKAPAKAAAKKAVPPKKKRDPDAVWTVQVGAFKQKSLANSWLKDVGKRFAKQLKDAEGKVVAGDAGWWRTRYEGLTKERAADACKALKAKKVPCMVMKS